MRLTIPLRQTLPVNLTEEVSTALKSAYSEFVYPTSCEALQQAYRDLDSLNRLREWLRESWLNLENVERALSESRVYLGAISSLSRKLDLEGITFPWTNTLTLSKATVQGRGIYFEILNVNFNIAALLTHKAQYSEAGEASSCFAEASGVLEHAYNDILPRLVDIPPPELDAATLQLLSNSCDLEAFCLLSSDPDSLWTASCLCKDLYEQAQQQQVLNWNFYGDLKKRCIALASEACISLAQTLHRSRKHDDKLLEKAVLLKCLELSEDAESRATAQAMLLEPLSRRSKRSLNDLEEVAAFVPSGYFRDSKNDHSPKNYVGPQESGFFKTLLPKEYHCLPAVLREKVCVRIEAHISELSSLNDAITREMVGSGVPVTAEISSRPLNVPETISSLIELAQVILNNETTEPSGLVRSCLELTESAVSKISIVSDNKSFANLSASLAATRANLSNLSAELQRHSDLILLASNILCNNRADLVSAFLNIPLQQKERHSKQRTQSMFMTRMLDAFKNIKDRTSYRQHKIKELRDQLENLDFYDLVISTLESMEGSDILSTEALLHTALVPFDEQLQSLTIERAITKQHIMMIAAFARQLRYQRENSLLDRSKGKAALTLVAAITDFVEIQSRLQNLKKLLMDTEQRLCKYNGVSGKQVKKPNSSNEVLKTASKPSPSEFKWKPGMSVSIHLD